MSVPQASYKLLPLIYNTHKTHTYYLASFTSIPGKGNPPEETHVGALFNGTYEHMSLQPWPRGVQPEEECVAGAQTHCYVSTLNAHACQEDIVVGYTLLLICT